MNIVMRYFSFVSAVTLAVVLLASCENVVVYNHYVNTPLSGWDKNDHAVFDVPAMKRSGEYGVEIGLRTTKIFPFTGLILVVEQTVEPGHRVYRDTVTCRVADEKGSSLGQGIAYSQHTFPVSGLHLSEGDSIHVDIRHIMKREILPGISDIGVKITRKQN